MNGWLATAVVGYLSVCVAAGVWLLREELRHARARGRYSEEARAEAARRIQADQAAADAMWRVFQEDCRYVAGGDFE